MAIFKWTLVTIGVIVGLYFVYLQAQHFETMTTTVPHTLPAEATIHFKRTNAGRTLTYQGRDGQTVLTLLQTAAAVTIDPQNPYKVLGIGSLQNNASHHWTYTVNEQIIQKPAGDFSTNDQQKIVWQYQKIKN